MKSLLVLAAFTWSLTSRAEAQSAELTPRGVDNVAAFARLLAYVRFFHPAPEAVRVNWDDFAIRGVVEVERAPGVDSLAQTLRALFAPIAPTVRVYRTGASAPPGPRPPAAGASVVYWKHFGVGSPSGGPPTATMRSPYSSTRVLAPLSSVGTPVVGPRGVPGGPDAPRVPDPASPLQRDLGAGLSVSLPIALYTGEQAIADSMQHANPAAAAGRMSPADRATRLADVILVWGVMQHFYAYHEIVHTDWPGTLTATVTRAATDRDGAQFQETLERMIAALRDGHGRVGSIFVGSASAAVRLGWVDGQIVVLAAGDYPREVGLRRGDVVIAIDGVSANEQLAALSERVSGATLQWIRASALSRLLAGPPRSSVTLRVTDGSTPPRDIPLPRIPGPLPAPPLPGKIAETAPGIFYVDLDRITDLDFTEALPRLARANGIVFDLRGYPRQVNTTAILSHLTDSTIHSARFEVPTVTLPDREGIVFTNFGWTIGPVAPRFTGRVAFISGGGSISYAESTLGVVEGHRLAAIVGEASAGTNGNVNPIMLPGGYSVSWTGMRVTKQDGTPHHGVGIIPTVPVSPTLSGIRAGRDEVLERALQVVGGGARQP